MNPIIRRRGKKTRFYVDNEVVECFGSIIKSQGVSLYVALARHAHSKDQTCFPSYETLMRESGIGKRTTLAKYLRILVGNNLIQIDRKRMRPNFYWLLDVEIAVDVLKRKKASLIADEISVEVSRLCGTFGVNKQCPNSSDISASRDTVSHTSKSKKEINQTFSEEEKGYKEEGVSSESWRKGREILSKKIPGLSVKPAQDLPCQE